MIPSKLPKLPKLLFNQEWTVTIDQKQMSEDGELLPNFTKIAFFWFNGKTSQFMNAEKQIIRLEGTLTALGDLFPGIDVTTGIATKGSLRYKIYRCKRLLNPDGSTYATVLELM